MFADRSVCVFTSAGMSSLLAIYRGSGEEGGHLFPAAKATIASEASKQRRRHLKRRQLVGCPSPLGSMFSMRTTTWTCQCRRCLLIPSSVTTCEVASSPPTTFWCPQFFCWTVFFLKKSFDWWKKPGYVIKSRDVTFRKEKENPN